MSDTINITTTILEEVVEITTTDNQTIVNVINQSGGTNITKTSDITNDGSDGTSTYVETYQLGAVAFSNNYNDLENKPTIPIVETPNLTQVIQQGELAYAFYGLATDAQLDINADWAITENYIETSGAGNGYIFLSNDLIVPNNAVIRFQLGIASEINTDTFKPLPVPLNTDAAVYYNGELVTSVEIRPSDYVILKYTGASNDLDKKIWLLTILSKAPTFFEVKITQTGTAAPNIVSDSIIGAKGAVLTTSITDNSLRITADLPIFQNVKEEYLLSDNRPSFFTSNSGASSVVFYSVCVEDHYNILIETYSFQFDGLYPTSGLLSSPVNIRIPFK